MIWLSSFPRSGNTFFRNVLFEVYGLTSSSYYEGKGEPENYTDFPFVKTHLLPHELVPADPGINAVYLVRDGRDALVSMIHQQIDIYGAKVNFRDAFVEAIIAAEGSYFGGWSTNVENWIDRGQLIIRFEDLIKDPIGQIDRIGSIYDLPEKDRSKLPSFQDLKYGNPKYGRGKRIANSEEEELEIVKKSFRKGKAYGWKDEIDRELQNMFWSYHRTAMEKLGYDRFGKINPLNPDFDYKVMGLLGHDVPQTIERKTILIEANKLLMHQNDGVKRYLLELLRALYPVACNDNGAWEIDVYLKGRVYPLKEFGASLFDANKNENHVDKFSAIRRLAVGAFRGFIGFIKFIIPDKYVDTVAKYYKKLLMKISLKFSQNAARASYLKEYIKRGKAEAQKSKDKPEVKREVTDYDLIHVPLPQHFEPFKKIKANFLVTMHDLTHRMFSEYHTSANVQVAEGGMNYFQGQDADFLCISEATKKDVIELCDVGEDKLYTVYEAADNQKFRPIVSKENIRVIKRNYDIPDKPYLFTLSTLEPRKNLVNTIKAFDLLLDENPDLDCNLVIGGKNGWKSKDLLQLKHQKNIVFTGFVNENDLPVLYNGAEALCYVSFYEGFGLPPLEAMSCKTPVIYGDNSSMKELFEGYGLAADAESVESIKNQMKLILTNSELKKELQEKSLERSFDFSWRQTAIDTLEVYEKVIDKNKAKIG